MISKHKTINKMQYAKFRNKHNLEKYTKEGLKMEIKEAIKKANELKQKMKNKQYIQVRKDNTDSYGYIAAIDTLVKELKMYQR